MVVFVNSTTLAAMTTYHTLVNMWCTGSEGPGSCQYGLGIEHNQIGLDYWAPFIPNLSQRSSRAHEAELIGHDGQDWGSSAAPCGYNPKFGFGLCLVHTSTGGLNCSLSSAANSLAGLETMCKVYDAVLGVVGGPRFSCNIPAPVVESTARTCEWRKIKGGPIPFKSRSPSEALKAFMASRESASQIMV